MGRRESLPVNELVTLTGKRVTFGTAAPTKGAFVIGDMVINTSPVADATFAWRCTVAGSPGTWVASASVTGSTATALELNSLTDLPTTVTTTGTPAVGSNAVQFVFKNAAGATITHAIAGSAYFSTVNGLAIAAVTSAATLTNGIWTTTTAGTHGSFISSAAGLLGLTVTAITGSYYLTFVLPNGKLLTSTVLTVQ